MTDPVNHPPHYLTNRRFEPLEVILDWELSYCLGNVVKYVARAGRKDDVIIDLRKAQFYLAREIGRLETIAESGGAGLQQGAGAGLAQPVQKPEPQPAPPDFTYQTSIRKGRLL